jgi:uncharacterized protein (TIGR03435 family)
MNNRVIVRLIFARKAALAVAAMGALAAVVVGLVLAPAILAQAPARSAASATPKFEVASIKPCKADVGGGVRVGNFKVSPGRLTVNCLGVMGMIREAYLEYESGHYHHMHLFEVPIEGAPGWVQSDRYSIEAKAEDTASQEIMEGPMLQALLEDRFQVKVRRATREVPVYELTVAKGGPKLQPFDRSCIPVDWDKTPQDPPTPKGPGDCRNVGGVSGTNLTRYWRGISIDNLILAILGKAIVGRPVINKTGIAGVFDIHLEFTREQNSDKPDAGPSIFTALQEQLGLKLVPAKGPEEYLVIEHVERPSEN